MNNFGRKMVRSLMLGGAIALGFATNSTDVKAAETTDEGAQLQLEDVSADTNAIIAAESEDDGLDDIGIYWNDPIAISEYREDMQRLRDAADVIEGDAVAEEVAETETEVDSSEETLEIEALVDSSEVTVEEVSEDVAIGEAEVSNPESEGVNFDDIEKEYYDIKEQNDALEYADTPEEVIAISEEVINDYEEINTNTEALSKELDEKLQKFQELYESTTGIDENSPIINLQDYLESFNAAEDDKQKAEILGEAINLVDEWLNYNYHCDAMESAEYSEIYEEYDSVSLDCAIGLPSYYYKLEEQRVEYQELIDDLAWAKGIKAKSDKIIKKLQKEREKILETGTGSTIITDEDYDLCNSYERLSSNYTNMMEAAGCGFVNGITKEGLDDYIDCIVLSQKYQTMHEVYQDKIDNGDESASDAIRRIDTEIDYNEWMYFKICNATERTYEESELKKLDDEMKTYEDKYENDLKKCADLKVKKNDYLYNSLNLGTSGLFKTASEYQKALIYRSEAGKLKETAEQAIKDNTLCNVDYDLSYDFDIYYNNKPTTVKVTVNANANMLGKNSKNIQDIKQFAKLAVGNINATISVTIVNESGTVASTVRNVVV